MNRLRRISPALVASWLIVAVFVISRGPLMPRALRHGWYDDMNEQYQTIVSARAFVQEGGRTPYFLFPRWSARPDAEQPWLLFASFPPLPYYLLTPIIALSRDPHAQIFFARLLATLVTAVGSWLVFCLFRRITQDDGLALIAQVVSTFEIYRYYFSDLPFGSQYGYTLGIAQVVLILRVVEAPSSKKGIWGAHLVSAVAALTWWLNSLILPTALALCYVLKVPASARRAIFGVAVSSTLVALATFSWLAVAELNQGVRIGTGAIGAGLRVLANIPGDWLGMIRRFGPVSVGQTYVDFFVRFVLPPFPLLVPDVSVGQQLTTLGLLPRYGFSLDQVVTVPLSALLGGLLAVLALRGIRGWFADYGGSERLAIAKLAVLLFILPGVVFVALLPSWTYAHHSAGRTAIAPVGIVLAIGVYYEVRRLIRAKFALLVAGWLTLWAVFGISMSYSMVKTFDDGYNRTELAALDWFRQHARPGSILINNIPAFGDVTAPFEIFYADARTYYWSGLAVRTARPVGLTILPGAKEVLPYLDGLRFTLHSLEGHVQSEMLRGALMGVGVLREVVGRSGDPPKIGRESEALGNLYGQVFADVRALNRELRDKGLPPISLPLPVNWKRHDNYLLLREDFGLPPLFRGIDYVVRFESEFSTAPEAFLGGRTSYVTCHEEVQGRQVPTRCRWAVKRAISAALRGDWGALRPMAFITPTPSYDNLAFPIRGNAGPTGKIRLLQLEGE